MYSATFGVFPKKNTENKGLPVKRIDNPTKNRQKVDRFRFENKYIVDVISN